ncbi:MAG: hypothetical protein KGM42_01985 [Hyphomicrobiales bacterium]|nr:hypothetical protein [Hyphomicrobiales bacterium]
MHSDRIHAMLYDGHEREAVMKSDVVVCVSKEMQLHLAAKHAVPLDRFLVCPIFPRTPPALRSPDDDEARETTRPLVIYAGGTQVWQRIGDMARAIASLRNRMDFLCLTPHPDVLRAHLREAKVPEWEIQRNVYSASHADVLAKYRLAQYGFLLRDGSIVNRVSCPTKLVEYLAHGVVPVLESESVGDFIAHGMRFLKVRDLEAGIPDEATRREMVEANYKVLKRLADQSRYGLGQLEKVLHAQA